MVVVSSNGLSITSIDFHNLDKKLQEMKFKKENMCATRKEKNKDNVKKRYKMAPQERWSPST
uniref:Uncharacterized protein n=1 Tax=Romanomermis culicivorax TaxID=13658 RepID=A0A915IR93_ROMCU